MLPARAAAKSRAFSASFLASCMNRTDSAGIPRATSSARSWSYTVQRPSSWGVPEVAEHELEGARTGRHSPIGVPVNAEALCGCKWRRSGRPPRPSSPRREQREGPRGAGLSAAFRPSVETFNMLSSSGATARLRMRSARSASEADIGPQFARRPPLTNVSRLAPSQLGDAQMPCPCRVRTSATALNMRSRSGTLAKRANRVCMR